MLIFHMYRSSLFDFKAVVYHLLTFTVFVQRLVFLFTTNEFSVSVLKPLLAQNIQPSVWTSEAFPSTYPVSGAPQVCLGSVSSSCFYSSCIGNDDTSVCPHYYTWKSNTQKNERNFIKKSRINRYRLL